VVLAGSSNSKCFFLPRPLPFPSFPFNHQQLSKSSSIQAEPTQPETRYVIPNSINTGREPGPEYTLTCCCIPTKTAAAMCHAYGLPFKCTVCVKQAHSNATYNQSLFLEPPPYTFYVTDFIPCSMAKSLKRGHEDWGVLPCLKVHLKEYNTLDMLGTEENGKCAAQRNVLYTQESVVELTPLAKDLYYKITGPSSDATLSEMERRYYQAMGDTDQAALQRRLAFTTWSEKANLILWIVEGGFFRNVVESGEISRMKRSLNMTIGNRSTPSILTFFRRRSLTSTTLSLGRLWANASNG
jgi:hypothetical protein